MSEETTVEHIEVEEPQIIEIEIDEAFPSVGTNNSELRHDLLNNRDIADQHPTSAITGLDITLKKISSVRNIYAKSGGLAEFRRWSDDNPGSEGRIGYFVSIVNNDGDIAICNKEYPDVYGVTVEQSGFCGYQNENYNYLNLDNNSINKTDNWQYAKVCIVGDVKVRIDPYSGISVGDYVLPGKDGYAEKSTSGIGFRVSSMNNGKLMNGDGVETIAHFATISLVPQNDNVARVMNELNTTNGNVGNIKIEVDNIKDQIGDIITEMGGDVEGIHGEISDIGASVKEILTDYEELQEIVKQAEENISEANEEIEVVKIEAIGRANKAAEDAAKALATVEDIDKTVSENGTNIVSIQKQTDAIQQLVARVNKYSIGKYSPSYKLTYEEAANFLYQDYIYVATENHSEVCGDIVYDFVTFDEETGRGKSYKWVKFEDNTFGWQDNAPLYTNSEDVPNGTDDDLWYCWKQDIDSYKEGTLYCYREGSWEAVASIDEPVRSIGYLRQTADELTSTYTDLADNISNITQSVDKISTVILDADGNGSTLEQVADQIIMGTFNPENSSSLALLLNGFSSIANSSEHICTNTMEGSKTPVGDRYSQPPTWNEERQEFVFYDEYKDADGDYYFYSEDKTRYCEVVENGEGYKIYTIGNIVLAAINTYISESKSAVDSWTKFKKGINETGTIIGQNSNENGASIASAVYGDFRYCEEIRTDLTEDEIDKIPKLRYIEKPNVDGKKFVFDCGYSTEGEYYLSNDGDGRYYCKVLKNRVGEIIGYEKYGINTSRHTAIMQEVDENGSVVALTAGNGEVDGGVFIKAINESSSAGILANKILLQTEGGQVTFADVLKPGTTRISGDHISSGVITSNNYNGPATSIKYGVKIDKQESYSLSENAFNFVSGKTKYTNPLGFIETVEGGYGYLGTDLNIDIGREYYCEYDNKSYTITASTQERSETISDPSSNVPDTFVVEISGGVTSKNGFTIARNITANSAIITATSSLGDGNEYFYDLYRMDSNTGERVWVSGGPKILDAGDNMPVSYQFENLWSNTLYHLDTGIEALGRIEFVTKANDTITQSITSRSAIITVMSNQGDNQEYFYDFYRIGLNADNPIWITGGPKIWNAGEDMPITYQFDNLEPNTQYWLDTGIESIGRIEFRTKEDITTTVEWTEYRYKLEQLPIGANLKMSAYLNKDSVFKGKIISGEATDCIYYMVITEGAEYNEPPAEGDYFIGATVGLDAELNEADISQLSPSIYSGFLISENDFELLPSSSHYIEGIKIDLNEGTIHSRNFTLDSKGDIKLTGSITWDDYESPDDLLSKANINANSIVRELANGGYEGTFINGKVIKSGLFYSTGVGDTKGDQSAFYICDNDLNIKGFLRYDSHGPEDNPYIAKERVLLQSELGISMKIHACGYSNSHEEGSPIANMSIGAGALIGTEGETGYCGEGYVYISSPIIFSGGHNSYSTYNSCDVQFGTSSRERCNVDFSMATVNFEGAKIKGLEIDTYAKFSPDPK